jgi:hypothetical protein
MNRGIPLALIVASVLLCNLSAAPQIQLAPNNSQKAVQILPFVKEFQTVKFKAGTSTVPNELSVINKINSINILGTKRIDTKSITGQLAGHFGKLVLLPVTQTISGTLQVKIPSVYDSTYYGIVLDVGGDVLKSIEIPLETGINYLWTLDITESEISLKVTNGDKIIGSIEASKSSVTAFGFWATVRYPKRSKADITVDIPQVK